MKRNVLLLLRSLVTVIVVGTMAVMIFSLREENAKLKSRLAAERTAASTDDGSVYVLCRFDLKPEADRAEYVKRTLAVAPTVRQEKGCRLYTLVGDAATDWEAPQRFGERTLWMLEKWDSIEALKAHLATPHMKAFGPTVRDMRTSGTFHVLSEIRGEAAVD